MMACGQKENLNMSTDSEEVPGTSRKRESTNGHGDTIGESKKPKMSSDPSIGYSSSKGLKGSLHGDIYQLKLLMLFVKRGLDMNCAFSLATEMDEAELFDDLVFKYEKSNEAVYKFLQAKHKQDDDLLLKSNDFLTESDSAFSLQQYLSSFLRILQKSEFRESEKATSHEFLICTNAGLNTDELEKNGLKFERVVDDDCIFKQQIQGDRYKLQIKEDNQKNIVEILKRSSDIYFLARKLALCLKSHKKLDLRDRLFKTYHEGLAREVIKVDYKKHIAHFQVAFLEGKDTLSEAASVFRETFQREYIHLSSPKIDENQVWEKLEKETFKISASFGKVLDTSKPNSILPTDILTESNIKLFLANLVFAVNQPNEVDLGILLEEEMGRDFKLADCSAFASYFLLKILDWFKEKKKETGKEGTFMTHDKGNDLLQSTKNKFQRCKFIGPSMIYRQKVENFRLEFKTDDENVKKIHEFFNLETENVIAFASKQPKLSAAKVVQALKESSKFHTVDSFVFMKSTSLNLLVEHDNSTSESERSTLFVIEWKEGSESDYLKLLNMARKVILLTSNEYQLTNYEQKPRVITDNNFFNGLIDESQGLVLENIVSFQGKPVKLEDMIDMTSQEMHNEGRCIIDDETLYKLVKNETHVVGQELDKFENYINRTWRSGVNKNVTPQFQTATEGPDKFVVIVGKPGMGKSTFLTRVAHQTKECSPSLWVVRVNLYDQSTLLTKMNFQEGGDSQLAVQFLINVLLLKTPIEQNLFEHACNTPGKVVLLFDAFDEISPTKELNVIALLKKLKETQRSIVWVMTRTHLQSKLEKKLDVKAYVIEPFSEENQHEFVNRNLLNIENFNQTIRYFSSTFLSNPLHLKMIVDVCNADFEGMKNEKENLDRVYLYEKFIYLKFYKYFQEDKNKADLTKDGISEDMETLYEVFLENHKLAALFALFNEDEVKDLLDEPEIKKANAYFLNKVKEGKERVGIITGISDDLIPRFVHRTYAEYLAALWFSECVQKEAKLENVRPFLKDRLYKAKWEDIRDFFDRILARGLPLHIATINRDYKSCKEYWVTVKNEDMETECNRLDIGGRSPLHLAAYYGVGAFIRLADKEHDYYSYLEMLVSNTAAKNMKDKVFKWKPINFAFINPCTADYCFAPDWAIERRLKDFLLEGSTVLTCDQIVNELKMLGNSVFQGAIQAYYLKHIEHYVEHRYSIFESFQSMSKLEGILFWIGKGVDVNAKDQDDFTVLDLAAYRSDWEMLMELIKASEANIHSCKDNGQHILHCAIIDNRLDMVKDLIEKQKVRVNTGDGIIDFALQAERKRKIDIVTDILGKRISYRVSDGICTSPLDEASRYKRSEVVQYLVENLQDKKGNTPESIALKKCSNEPDNDDRLKVKDYLEGKMEI